MIIDCPCCKAKLELDLVTGAVKPHAEPGKKKSGDPIKDAFARMKAEKEKRETFFDDAKDILEKRKQETEDKFKDELNRIKKTKDASRPPSPFDLD